MSTARSHCVALVGIEGHLVEVEAAVGSGLPRTVLIGLPDASLYESRDRCRAAISQASVQWPQHLLTINLSPASLPKAGSHYDLAILAAILAANGAIAPDALGDTVFLGEIGLDGRVHKVRGLLPAVLGAVRAGHPRVVVPTEQMAEATLAPGAEITGVSTLAELIALLRGEPVPQISPLPALPAEPRDLPDLADVLGQPEACWAAEVAASGGHHMFLHGPRGVGKSLLASRLPSILPELTIPESLEVAAVRSLAGLDEASLSSRPPWSEPHHTASLASLVGGGPRIPRPGAVSLAHRGVLFLDEAREFAPRSLEALRTPLETGEIGLYRSVVHATFPARFQLVLAANPCPCGDYDRSGGCQCPAYQVRRYRDRISGPILDRIDIHQHLRPMSGSVWRNPEHLAGQPSAVVAERVVAARERQRARLAGTGWRTNAEVPGAYLRSELPPVEGIDLIEREVTKGRLSSRGADKCVRLAWTVADLAGHNRPTRTDLDRAMTLRLGDGA